MLNTKPLISRCGAQRSLEKRTLSTHPGHKADSKLCRVSAKNA
jgi:hypothetical protein